MFERKMAAPLSMMMIEKLGKRERDLLQVPLFFVGTLQPL